MTFPGNPMARNFICTAALAVLMLTTQAASAADSLFRALVPTAATAVSLELAEVRARQVKPELALLPQLAASTTDQAGGPIFTLNLFDDVALNAQVVRVEYTADGGVAIVARLTDSDLGTA